MSEFSIWDLPMTHEEEAAVRRMLDGLRGEAARAKAARNEAEAWCSSLVAERDALADRLAVAERLIVEAMALVDEVTHEGKAHPWGCGTHRVVAWQQQARALSGGKGEER